MSVEDTRTYCNCMEEVRQRVGAVKWLVAGNRLMHQDFFLSAELVFLQLRKILELIAFASLTANREKYSAACANWGDHWKARKMLEALEELNPDFYPVPLDAPVVLPNGNKHFARPSDGFMTKDEFVRLYDCSHEILHARNPFSSKDPVTQIGYTVDVWVARIQRLLAWHLMHLVDGDKWVVTIPQDGPVRVLQATPFLTELR